jgi:hypothetical protein
MKVIFDLVAGRLAIEGDGPELLKILQVARELAPNLSQIQIHATGPNPQSPDPHWPSLQLMPGQQNESKQSISAPTTLRQFARQLSLSNASERIAGVAYYVNKIDTKPSFSPRDMDGWFTMCGFQKPGNMAVAIFDCKRKYGYIENIGRAMWKISTQGENLILGMLENMNAK